LVSFKNGSDCSAYFLHHSKFAKPKKHQQAREPAVVIAHFKFDGLPWPFDFPCHSAKGKLVRPLFVSQQQGSRVGSAKRRETGKAKKEKRQAQQQQQQ